MYRRNRRGVAASCSAISSAVIDVALWHHFGHQPENQRFLRVELLLGEREVAAAVDAEQLFVDHVDAVAVNDPERAVCLVRERRILGCDRDVGKHTYSLWMLAGPLTAAMIGASISRRRCSARRPSQ